MKMVYLAGPMTKGQQFDTCREAMRQASLLLEAGSAIIVPQLSHFWHMVYPLDYERILSMDFEMLSRCDLVIRIPGESTGADREVAHARELGIPVFIGTADEYLAQSSNHA